MRELSPSKASPAYTEKIHAKKVGWDKRSVPNMFVKEYLDVQHILLDFRMESTSLVVVVF